jgi:class 3 adenylate cyclase/tetratricopeptide (TPR) repeat protein
MNERQRLQKAIAELEAQRGVLSEEVISASVAALQRQLAVLEPPEQHRKLVTILFADIVDSTRICQHLDPEDVMQLMDGLLKRLALPIEKFGGHVTRFMGDGFMALFGAPVARENDPEMAIRAGLGILTLAQQIAPQLERDWDLHDLQVRVGISTGLAVLGGQTEAQDTVMGSTVNLAARLETAALPGSVLISNDTYRHVRGIFEIEPQTPLSAKGFDQQVEVFQVLHAKPRAFHLRTRSVEGIETRMVGRGAELLSLQNSYHDAVQGQQTQVVTVVGEAGVGKSRLLYEFDDWLHRLAVDIHLYQGRGRQETQNQPYALLRDLFAFRFQIQDSDSASVVCQKIESGFGVVFGQEQDDRMKSQICGQLLGYDISHSLQIKGILEDPQQLHDRAQHYLQEYFRSISESAPAVIFLDDIHWADDSTLDMVNNLAQHLTDQRLLFICLARHRLYEQHPCWGDGLPNHQRLELLPLSSNESGQLVEEILVKVNNVPKDLCELVVAGAEGNPFYIEELVKMLIEDGVIRTGPDEWYVELDRLAEFVVPATLVGILQARLESLPVEERTTLQQASVVGRIFWDNTIDYINTGSNLEGTSDALSTVVQYLSSLISRELIYKNDESTFTDASEYIFKHAMLRDVTYESLLKRLRRIYHGLVADWLIQHGGERLSEYTSMITEHMERAGRHEQAIHYLQLAGDQAVKQYANKEAIRFYQRALALSSELKSEDLDLLETRSRIHESLADVNNTIGEHNYARSEFLSALALTRGEDILWKARLQRKIGTTWQDQGLYEESELAFEAAEKILGDPPTEYPQDWWCEWIWIQINRMYGLYARAQSDQMAALVKKIGSAVERFGNPPLHEAFYSCLARMYLRRDRYVVNEELLDISRKQLSAATETGDKQKLADAHFWTGFILLWHGDLDQSEIVLKQALNLAEQSANLYTQTLCFTYLAILYRFRKQIPQVQEYIESSIITATKRQMIDYIGTAKANQAWVDWYQGGLATVESNGKEALKLWRQVPYIYPFRWTALWPLIAVALEKDQTEQAIQYASDLLAPEQQQLPPTVTASLEQAIQAWHADQPEVARQKLGRSLALAKEIKQL